MKIPYKIFGVAVLVLVLMSTSIVYSTYKLYSVKDEVTSLAASFIPLAELVAKVDLQTAKQELHLERLEKHLTRVKLIDAQLTEVETGKTALSSSTGQKTSTQRRMFLEKQRAALNDRIAAEEKMFLSRLSQVDQAIAGAEKIVIDALTKAASDEERATLIALSPLLQSVDQQHANLHAQMNLLIGAYKQNNPILTDLEALVESEREQLTQRIDSIWKKIALLTQNSAKTVERHQQAVLFVNVILAVVAGVLSLLLSAFVIRGMLQPLKRLVQGTQAVEAGNLTGELSVDTRDEIGELTSSFNNMVMQLRKTEEIKDTFGQYVDPRVVSGLIDDSNRELVNGEKKLASVFFADFANFTGISERFTPDGMVKLVNRYLSLMSAPVVENNGLIDKYIGDAIMAFWAPPFCVDGTQASLAVTAAMQDMDRLELFRQELPELMGLRRDLPDVNMRIGIATGDAVVGSVGSQKTKNFTVIGDTVNLGSRLEGANKTYGTTILVCRRTFEMASDAFEFRKIDDLIVFGKTEPISVFQPLGRLNSLSPQVLEYRDQFEKALQSYQNGDWRVAIEKFRGCLKSDPNDPVVKTYLRRLDHIETNGPPDYWDGVWRLDEKD